MGITPKEALDRLHHSDVSEAKRWGMSDETSDLCRDIIVERIAALEAALRWYVDNDDTNLGDPENQFWAEGHERAKALLAEPSALPCHAGEKERG